MKFTSEQEQLFALALERVNIDVQATAGSGKTTAAVELIHRFTKKYPTKSVGLFLFGKMNADDAKEKLQSLGIYKKISRTFHSHSFLNAPREVRNALVMPPFATTYSLAMKEKEINDPKIFSKGFHNRGIVYIASKVVETMLKTGIKKCQTIKNVSSGAEAFPTTREFLAFSASDSPFNLGNFLGVDEFDQIFRQMKGSEGRQKYIDAVTETANKYIYLILAVKTPLNLTMLQYLYCISDSSIIDDDLIIIDEQQDTMGVVKILLQRTMLRRPETQLITIGDTNQAIHKWNNSVDLSEELKPLFDTRHYLTQSFRFGNDIAELGNEVINTSIDYNAVQREKINAKGWHDVKPNKKYAHLCRTNSGVVSHAYRMYKSDFKGSIDDKIGISGIIDIISDIHLLRLNKWKFIKSPVVKSFGNFRSLEVQVKSGRAEVIQNHYNLYMKYGLKSLQDMLNGLSIVRSSNDESVTLSTIHRSKGMEFDKVFLHGVDYREDDHSYHTINIDSMIKAHGRVYEGYDLIAIKEAMRNIPHKSSYIVNGSEFTAMVKGFNNDEARLLYVGVTRAKSFVNHGDTDLDQFISQNKGGKDLILVKKLNALSLKH